MSLQSKKHYQDNKTEIAIKRREYYKENKERIAKRHSEYYKANKAKIRARALIYRIENPEAVTKGKLAYSKANKDKITRYIVDVYRKRPQNKIAHNLRGRINRALKGQTKSDTTSTLIGCSMVELKAYLQARFLEGMSWNNYGKWHIDHIKPCASFDLSDPNQQAQCFYYTNLQPLWAKDNLSKGAR